MTQVEKIKAYLENRQKELEDIKKKGEWTTAELGDISCCKQTLSFIDSLSDTEKDFGIKSNDLEEAAHSYVDTTIEWFDSEGNPCCYPAFIAGAQWQKKRDNSNGHYGEWQRGYEAGMKEMKQQMMKDAVSMDIYYETEWDDIHKFLRKNLDGEHVKLVIIKEE